MKCLTRLKAERAGGLMRKGALEFALMMAGKKLRKASARLEKWKVRKVLMAGERQMGLDEERLEQKADRKVMELDLNRASERGKTGIAEHMPDMLARPKLAGRKRRRRRGGWGTPARQRAWRKLGAEARGLRAPTGQARQRRRPVLEEGRLARLLAM
jgi:hypothetical protein